MVINLYITTLLLPQEEEEEEEEEPGVATVTGEDEASPPLGHVDAMDRVLTIIPKLISTSDLTDSLSAALLKVRALGVGVVWEARHRREALACRVPSSNPCVVPLSKMPYLLLIAMDVTRLLQYKLLLN